MSRRRSFKSAILGDASDVEHEKKWFLIYPGNRLKLAFDFVIALLLIYTCNAVPIQLAFFSDGEENFTISNMIVDVFFYIDILVTFFTVIVDKDLDEIEDLGEIALIYFKGWIYIDVLSVIPFELFASAG